MKNDFIIKLQNKKYISKYLYELVLKENREIIPLDFNIDRYNSEVLDNLYIKYQDYFKNMYKGVDDNIILDKEQIMAVTADEDYSLIIAGAGTGKTTTIVSKVKYLVDKLGVNPKDILVMSYTGKATNELVERIKIDFNIDASVMTFHALGMEYIRQIFKGHKCYVVDDNIKNKIFLEFFDKYIFRDKGLLTNFLETFSSENTGLRWVFANFLKENYDKYDTYNELFHAYKKYKTSEIQNIDEYVNARLEYEINKEVPLTIKGEYVKSKGEAIIANFLFINGIEYTYEKLYPDLVGGNRTYKPDFTIDYDGEELYIEYFGLSNDNNNKTSYEKNKQRKIKYHQKHMTKFIMIEYGDSNAIIDSLTKQLAIFGINLKPKNSKEIYDRMLDRYQSGMIFPLCNLFYKAIEQIKSSNNRLNYKDKCLNYINALDNDNKQIAVMQLTYIDKFYKYYQKCLYGNKLEYGFDFPDMIYYANKYLNYAKSNELNFKYIVIDEYQDISKERYKLTKNISDKNHAKIIAVGDDWQSIYAFNGSKIEYIYDFSKYFPSAKIFNITKTYRNSQELIEYSGDFIMKNEKQIKKTLVSDKHINKPVRFCLYEGDEEYLVLKELILKIHQKNPNHNILILGRTNKIINSCFNEPELVDAVGSKVTFLGYEDIDIDAMTIHKAKGLTSDEVIVIGLNEKFPSSNHQEFWMINLFKEKVGFEDVPYPEERRLFYVALTRTKNNVYLLVNKNPRYRSTFVNEIYNIIREKDEKKLNAN